MKIGAIIQARTSSTRLPGKVLKTLPYGGDVSVLQHVIRRVSRASLIDDVIVATTANSDDDEIVEVAIEESVNCYRGSLENVLERYYGAASENGLDIVVRITSDNPCIDFKIIDDVIESHLELHADYTSNALNGTIPEGLAVEVVNFDILKQAYENANEKYEKEHVTPYIYKTHPENFKINRYVGTNLNFHDIRLTLDTPQDYALLSLIYEELYDKKEYFDLNDILELFIEKPYLKDINSEIVQKKVCNNLEEELNEVINICEMQDLEKAKVYIEHLIK